MNREGQVWRLIGRFEARTFLVLRTYADDEGIIRHEALQLDTDEGLVTIEGEWQSEGPNSWESMITFVRIA